MKYVAMTTAAPLTAYTDTMAASAIPAHSQRMIYMGADADTIVNQAQQYSQMNPGALVRVLGVTTLGVLMNGQKANPDLWNM